MGNPFQLSELPIYFDTAVSSTPVYQPLREALDISAFDEMDVLLNLASAKTATSGSITVEISTGMQTQTDDGWVTAGTFTAMTAVGSQKIHVTGLLQYIRWRVTSQSFDNVNFAVTGILRSRGL
jgi:hypothetical protein